MNNSSDVVIIGGGAIGLCTAYYLRTQGVNVIILEKGEIGSGCSFKNAGLIAPSHFIPLSSPGIISKGLKWMLNPDSPFYIKPRLDLDFLAWLWKFRASANETHVRNSMTVLRDMNLASSGLYRDLASLDGFEFGLTHRGVLMLYNTKGGMESNMHEADLGLQLGLRVRKMTAEEINTLEPGLGTQATGGVLFEDDSHMTPELFIQRMCDRLVRDRVQMHTATEVTGLEVSHGRVKKVRTTRGEFTANEFVLAGGSWSARVLAMLGRKLMLQPGKGYSVTVDRPDRTFQTPLILTEARVAVTPMGSRLRFAGTMELAGLDLSITWRRVHAILKSASRYLSGFDPAQVDITEAWAGLRPCTPDGLPYIGRVPEAANLTLAAGHAMLGISLAPVTGKLVSELIAGRGPLLDLTPFRVDRF